MLFQDASLFRTAHSPVTSRLPCYVNADEAAQTTRASTTARLPAPRGPWTLATPERTKAHAPTHAHLTHPRAFKVWSHRPAIKAAPPASCPLAFQGQILTLLYYFCFLHVLAGGGGGGGGGACSAPADRLDFGAPPVYARARGNSDANRGHAVGEEEEEEEEEGIGSSTYRNACLPPRTDRILVSSLLYPLPCFASRCDLHVSRPWMAISRCGNRTIPRRVAPHWAQALSRFQAGRTPTVLAAPAKYRTLHSLQQKLPAPRPPRPAPPPPPRMRPPQRTEPGGSTQVPTIPGACQEPERRESLFRKVAGSLFFSWSPSCACRWCCCCQAVHCHVSSAVLGALVDVTTMATCGGLRPVGRLCVIAVGMYARVTDCVWSWLLSSSSSLLAPSGVRGA